MAEPLNIPTLEGLNPDAEDYVAKLDEGLVSLRPLYAQAIEDIKSRFKAVHGDVVDALKGAGFEVSNTSYEELDSESDPGIKFKVEGTSPTDKSDARRLEDMLRESMGQFQSEFGDYSRRVLQITRAHEDYKDALLGLTHVEPLKEVDGNQSELHIYTVFRGKVYEMHVDYESKSVTRPNENKDMTPEMFTDPKSLEGIREAAKSAKGNAYLITNPSSELSVGAVGRYGSKIIRVEYEEARRTAETSKSPSDKFKGSMSRGSSLLKRLSPVRLGRKG